VAAAARHFQSARRLHHAGRSARRRPAEIRAPLGSPCAVASVCALNPHRDEASIAQELRRASPTATPNIRIVSLADRLLGRDGRMVAAIETIGRGTMALEGNPFRLELE
jgi:hypothetical protein